jgi:hypothetical protein
MVSLCPTAQAWLAPSGGSDPAVAAPPPVTQEFDSNTGILRVAWTVDARKLRGNSKQAVSDAFYLNFGSEFSRVPFKIVVYPKPVSNEKNGSCFKKSRGRGFLRLKCEADLSNAVANLAFRFSIGSGQKRLVQGSDIEHNFATNAVCDTCHTEWPFHDAIDEGSDSFRVLLEINARAS